MKELSNRYQVIRSSPYLGDDNRSNTIVARYADLDQAQNYAVGRCLLGGPRIWFLVYDTKTGETWKALQDNPGELEKMP